jgi:quercetin dioxygenase-like cupin family protein
MLSYRRFLSWLLPLTCIATIAGAAAGDSRPADGPHPSYSYATNGVYGSTVRAGDEWRLLVDESVLGGKEIEMTELTMPAGTVVPGHLHRSLEVIYVLSGIYGHEVNGKLYLLRPGMVGIVRPGDSVRHLVPKSGPTKVLIIWAPAGEAARIIPKGAPAAPVPEASSLDP